MLRLASARRARRAQSCVGSSLRACFEPICVSAWRAYVRACTHARDGRGGGLCRDLHSNAIGGTLPASLSALTNLEYLCAARPVPLACCATPCCALRPRGPAGADGGARPSCGATAICVCFDLLAIIADKRRLVGLCADLRYFLLRRRASVIACSFWSDLYTENHTHACARMHAHTGLVLVFVFTLISPRFPPI
jgi:hypothetical protein